MTRSSCQTVKQVYKNTSDLRVAVSELSLLLHPDDDQVHSCSSTSSPLTFHVFLRESICENWVPETCQAQIRLLFSCLDVQRKVILHFLVIVVLISRRSQLCCLSKIFLLMCLNYPPLSLPILSLSRSHRFLSGTLRNAALASGTVLMSMVQALCVCGCVC